MRPGWSKREDWYVREHDTGEPALARDVTTAREVFPWRLTTMPSLYGAGKWAFLIEHNYFDNNLHKQSGLTVEHQYATESAAQEAAEEYLRGFLERALSELGAP